MFRTSVYALRLVLGAVVVLTGSLLSADDPAEPEKPKVYKTIEVTDSAIDPTAAVVVEREVVRSTPPVGDGSEVLRDIAGADLGRMGGHGLEVFVRGQSQGDITVLLDGATVNGGCPNRMDPPTSFAAAETTDEVIVIRGVQTLRYGPGAPGGTVLFERHAPAFDDTTWTADVGLGASTWSEGPDVGLDAAFGLGSWSLRALASYRNSGNYEDGSGAEIRSAAESRSAVLFAGWRPDEATTLDLSYEHTATDDALFAGAGMDAPEDRGDTFRFSSVRAAVDGSLGWKVNAFANSVEHLMDNYSLRPLTAPMAMRVPTDTSTWGLRGHLELGSISPILLGITLEEANADATRFAGPNPQSVNMVQSIMWPDVTRDQIGIFAESSALLGGSTRLVYGARVDYFSADASRATEQTMGGNGPAPQQLWMQYFGNVDNSWSATDFSALVRLEHQTGAWRFFTGLSRSVRAADATERYLASNSSMAAKRWIGNPDLDLAKHHQLDFGAAWHGSGHRLDATVFFAEVDGHLLRDRAHGQEGILRDDNATIYRNVDVRRKGIEVDGLFRVAKSFVLSGGLAWVWAENTTDDRPLAQTPPFNGNVAAAWSSGVWSLSGNIRWAANQDRVDDNPMTGSGVDAGPTPGWATFDLFGDVDLGAGFNLAAGLANAFDRTYATHLNRASLFDPDPVRVNEPGRSFWVRIKWRGEG